MNDLSSLAVADHLLKFDIPMVIIGGHAVNIHGFARATEDVDVVFRRTTESEHRLAEALIQIHAYWIGDDIDPTTGIETSYPVTFDYVRQTHLMMLGTDLGFLDLFDFIPSMPGENLNALFDTAIIRNGRPFASLRWIRAMKQAAGRPQDRLDLENLPDQ
ncbi:hypothetical protein [Neorhodopirellula pilleata]|uniref:Nucleotidyltransferase n=1 Tax=Neorhodopirellula pilleata TaxID=2714738 RepID=A0A5C6AFI2_9BACT|nr:hypothetical protein [Neorhodopirellula pilleata]TWT98792.1 hypothetical protein Pla100_19580 [Neorhodopirellula pilleata]